MTQLAVSDVQSPRVWSELRCCSWPEFGLEHDHQQRFFLPFAESINGFAVVARALFALGVRQLYGVIGIPVTELASAAQVSPHHSVLKPSKLDTSGVSSSSSPQIHLQFCVTCTILSLGLLAPFITSEPPPPPTFCDSSSSLSRAGRGKHNFLSNVESPVSGRHSTAAVVNLLPNRQ